MPKRALSALNLVGLGIGGTIGAGIFVLTGHAAAANAGPAVTLSFTLGAVACAFAGLCYAELSSTIPISGSAYTYAYATMGELIAWIIGWDLILEYAVAAAAVAVGWSGYVVNVLHDLGWDIPARFASAPYVFDSATHAWSSTGAMLNIPAVFIVVAITALLTVGIRETARFNDFIVVAQAGRHPACLSSARCRRSAPRTGSPRQSGGRLHPAQHRARRVRLVRRAARRGGGVLCLYRF